MGLPVIVEARVNTMVQERYNLEWIREQGVGLVLKRTKDLPRRKTTSKCTGKLKS
jgi:hypothetical protein